MSNEPNQIDLMLDRRNLIDLRELAAEIIARMEAIEAKYPAGTFEGAEPEPEPEPEPRATMKRGPKTKRININMTLSDSIRTWVASHGSINIHEFAKANGHFNKNSVYPTVRSMNKRGHLRQDETDRAIYYPA